MLAPIGRAPTASRVAYTRNAAGTGLQNILIPLEA
jgi:hypothetical protein